MPHASKRNPKKPQKPKPNTPKANRQSHHKKTQQPYAHALKIYSDAFITKTQCFQSPIIILLLAAYMNHSLILSL